MRNKCTIFSGWSILGLIFVIIYLVVVHYGLQGYAFDDAFIHFRISNNLSQFGVPFYNPTDPLKASTSTGWIIFLSTLVNIFKFLGIKIYLPSLVGILNAFFILLGALLFSTVLCKIGEDSIPRYFPALFFLIYLSLTMSSSLGLMEIPLSLVFCWRGVESIYS